MEKTFKIWLWCGCGYLLTPFVTTAYHEEEALEKVTAQIINDNKTDFFLTEEEYHDLYTEEEIENEETSYLYVDATMEGAPYPVYVCLDNMKIEEI